LLYNIVQPQHRAKNRTTKISASWLNSRARGVTMFIPDAAFWAVRFCSSCRHVVRSTIGLRKEN